jgi:hypothetical protein
MPVPKRFTVPTTPPSPVLTSGVVAASIAAWSLLVLTIWQVYVSL